MTRWIAAAVAALLAAVFAFSLLAGRLRRQPPGPPPDLTGHWITVGKTGEQDRKSEDYYQIATITQDKIEVFWYTERTGHLDLYWSGTFVPPTTDGEYSWESVNDPERSKTTRFALRDPTKTFLYKDGELTYNVMMGHIKMSISLDRRSGLTPEELGEAS